MVKPLIYSRKSSLRENVKKSFLRVSSAVSPYEKPTKQHIKDQAALESEKSAMNLECIKTDYKSIV
ncbi:hypothetical protein BST81_09040 [Leptolyngbya sp. 'hensonii']|nr:hypothetical protein BST81_09040 [Leptolyngbya sp. 'hensonii']